MVLFYSVLLYNSNKQLYRHIIMDQVSQDLPQLRRISVGRCGNHTLLLGTYNEMSHKNQLWGDTDYKFNVGSIHIRLCWYANGQYLDHQKLNWFVPCVYKQK